MEYLPHYLVAIVSTVVLTLLLRRPAVRIGLIDHPGGRKQHHAPVPLVGGATMFLSFAFVVAWLLPLPVKPYGGLFVGMTLLVLVGLWDDRFHIAPSVRLLVQALAAILMAAWGAVDLHGLGNLLGRGDIQLGFLAIPFTVICVVALINAINMADGFDGLAGGTVLVALGWLALVAGISGINDFAVPMLGTLAAVIFGFLLFNMRNPWRRTAAVFMGDAGSTMLGFSLAWFAVYISQSPAGSVSPITVAWIVAMPIFDTTTVTIRRLVAGRSPFSPGRDHLHHTLLRVGLNPARMVYWLVALATITGGIGVLGWLLNVGEWIMFLLLLMAWAAHYWFSLFGWKALKRALNCPGSRRHS